MSERLQGKTAIITGAASGIGEAMARLAEDVAQAALWLAGDEAGYASGTVLTTDAGFTAGARPDLPFVTRRWWRTGAAPGPHLSPTRRRR